MATLDIRPAGSCRYDLVSLGEIMLRLDPSEGRVRTARDFKVWEGGGEYNVARGLRRCFGLKTAVCTAFADNDVGRLLEDFILQGGVDTEFIKWVAYDGAAPALPRRRRLRASPEHPPAAAERRARQPTRTDRYPPHPPPFLPLC